MTKNLKKELRNQIIFIIAFFAVWQIIYYTGILPAISFPSMKDVFKELIDGFANDQLALFTLYSLSLIAKGMIIGVVLAFVFSSLSIVFKTFYSIYNMIVSVFDLIPGVALLPLAIVWFGVGEPVIILIVVHGIIWPMSRSILDGFRGIPKLYIEEGRNFGLSGFRLVLGTYLPAAFSAILSGLRVGWARAWRGLLAMEMIFGTTGSGAGVGWFIFMKRTQSNTAGVIAALIVIMIIGIVMEYAVFRTIEKKTVKKWGMTE